MPLNGVRQRRLARPPCLTHSREDPAARSVQLFVGRAGCAERELLDAVAREARMGVAVDQAGHGAEPVPVQLLDVALERAEVAHPADCGDRRAVAQHVCVFEHLDLAQGLAASRRVVSGRRRELRETAHEQARRRRGDLAHPATAGGLGSSSPCASAAATASA